MTAPADPFSPEVAAAVSRHMNDDHAEDTLVICRALADLPAATAARMTGLDRHGIVLAATVAGDEVEARVPWVEPPADRAAIRAEVVRMYDDACARLGVER